MRAALVASCLRGALPPVDLRAVCLVRAMLLPTSLPYTCRDKPPASPRGRGALPPLPSLPCPAAPPARGVRGEPRRRPAPPSGAVNPRAPPRSSPRPSRKRRGPRPPPAVGSGGGPRCGAGGRPRPAPASPFPPPPLPEPARAPLSLPPRSPAERTADGRPRRPKGRGRAGTRAKGEGNFRGAAAGPPLAPCGSASRLRPAPRRLSRANSGVGRSTRWKQPPSAAPRRAGRDPWPKTRRRTPPAAPSRAGAAGGGAAEKFALENPQIAARWGRSRSAFLCLPIVFYAIGGKKNMVGDQRKETRW